MKKTLCYKAVARKTDKMVSDGFIVVEIENRKIISLEGIFTVDYLTSKIDDDIIEFEYYTLNEMFNEYINTVEIPVRTEEFVLPCTVTLVLKDGNKFEIEIIDRVFDKQLENHYQESLKKLKSSIFRLNVNSWGGKL